MHSGGGDLRAALFDRLEAVVEVCRHLGDGGDAEAPLQLRRLARLGAQHRAQRRDLLLQLRMRRRQGTRSRL